MFLELRNKCLYHLFIQTVILFAGHCQYNYCDQRCRDIDNGGYACECYDGYLLNPDGISCTSKIYNNISCI